MEPGQHSADATFLRHNHAERSSFNPRNDFAIKVLTYLHSPHQGQSRKQQRARQILIGRTRQTVSRIWCDSARNARHFSHLNSKSLCGRATFRHALSSILVSRQSSAMPRALNSSLSSTISQAVQMWQSQATVQPQPVSSPSSSGGANRLRSTSEKCHEKWPTMSIN